jgi:hypothetical protein
MFGTPSYPARMPAMQHGPATMLRRGAVPIHPAAWMTPFGRSYRVRRRLAATAWNSGMSVSAWSARTTPWMRM